MKYTSGQSVYSSKPTGVPKGYYAAPVGNGEWIVMKGTATSSANTTLNASSSLPLPAETLKKYGLPASLSLSYNPGQGKGAPYAPTSGKELYESIQQARSTGKITQAQANELVSLYFAPGFNPSEKDGSKVLTAATMQLQGSNYNLAAYTAPTVSLVNSSLVANTIKTELSAAQFNQQSLALNEAQYNLAISTATASQQQSAYNQVMNYLDQWGLQSVAPLVYKMVTKSGDHLINYEAILNAVRGEAPSNLGPKADAQLKAAYQKAFPGLTQYNTSPGAIHMTESAYMTYSQSIMNSATQYGAPMPTQAQIGELINHHVSAAEYQQRVVDIYAAVQNADQGTKNILAQQYGINSSDLMKYMINGSLPEEQRTVAAAEIQDYANRVGLTGLTKSGAGELGDMAKLASTAGNQALGYGVSQIESALNVASKDQPLLRTLPGQGAPTIDTNTLIGSQLAGFGGTNQAAAQVQLQRAEQAKAAPFEKGGGYTETAKGVTGIGTART